MVATKTNERPGTRAQVRHVRMSASKVREVLDLVRGLPVGEASDVLEFTERAASQVISGCLDSAIANAQHNDELDPDTLFISACYADEGPTLKRWRPRARGRATRIRKRMCHITIIVSPMPAEMVAKLEAKQGGAPAGGGRRRRASESRRARVARSRGETVEDETPTDEPDAPTDEVVEDEPATGEPTDEMVDEATESAVEEIDAEEAAEAEADETENAADDTEDEDVADTADAEDEKNDEA
jgi:large subunit ribosomal protein L22